MSGAGGITYPTLRLENLPPIWRIFSAIAFVKTAWRVIENRRIAPNYTLHIVGADQCPIGVTSGDIQYPISDSEIAEIEPFLLDLEDRRFYKHRGVDIRAVARASMANLRAGRVTQGAGTLTQQLIRNTLLTPAPSVVRKVLEIVFALKMERHYTKSEILRRYCELVYLGGGIRGFAAAARSIYRRRLGELGRPQQCGVIGLLRTPGRTYPNRDSNRFESRRQVVAEILRKRGNEIDSKDCAAINPVQISQLKRPRLTHIVRSELANNSQFSSQRITRVSLSIDRSVQDALESAAKQVSLGFEVKAVAGVVLDLKSGSVLAESACAGGRSMEFSPAYFGRIQPGSTFKTFALISALEQGMTPDTVLESSPFESVRFKSSIEKRWRVRSFRDEYRGPVSLASAFTLSDNTVFARVAEKLDLGRLYEVFERFHLARAESLTPAVVLGSFSGGTNLIALASAYRAIASGGVYTPATIVDAAWSRGGEVLKPARLVWPSPLIDSFLLEAIERLLAEAGKSFSGAVFSGKTGTTRTGSLFAGYNDKVAAAIWVGYRRRQSEYRRKGVGALDVMSGLVERLLGHKSSFLSIG